MIVSEMMIKIISNWLWPVQPTYRATLTEAVLNACDYMGWPARADLVCAIKDRYCETNPNARLRDT